MGNQNAMRRRFGGNGLFYSHCQVQGLFLNWKQGENYGLQMGYLNKTSRM